MACRILYEQFLEYTSRVFESLGITQFKTNRDGKTLFVPPNVYRKGEPIILVPRDILRDLPIAHDWSDISYVCATNAALRQKISSLIGEDWQDKTKGVKKSKIREFLISNPEFFEDIIKAYKKADPTKYNFNSDPSGEASWVRIAQQFTGQDPIKLDLPSGANQQDLYKTINSICMKFRDLIEHNGMWQFLYKENSHPKHESASQLIFFAVSSIYCEANNLSLARESNAGRGPVDFKLANGKANVIVEIKLSSNSHLIHAYEKQIPIYQKSEGSIDSIMVIILVKENSSTIDRLLKLKADHDSQNIRTPNIILIDGTPKDSASKAKK